VERPSITKAKGGKGDVKKDAIGRNTVNITKKQRRKIS